LDIYGEEISKKNLVQFAKLIFLVKVKCFTLFLSVIGVLAILYESIGHVIVVIFVNNVRS